MPEPSPLWAIVVKIAVEVAEETEARSLADMLIGMMQVTTLGPGNARAPRGPRDAAPGASSARHLVLRLGVTPRAR